MARRWATFDCYGTLIDWDGGIRRELGRLFGADSALRLLERYHQLEPVVQANGYRTYRDVLRLTLEQLARAEGLPVPADEENALARSLPSWEPFADVREALSDARRRGWRLAILSNCDRDLIASSIERIGVPFDHVVVAEDIGSYKPEPAHWERFFADTSADRASHVHVAASSFHDIEPASRLGLRTLWVNRLGERDGSRATREIRDLEPLPDALDHLVRA